MATRPWIGGSACCDVGLSALGVTVYGFTDFGAGLKSA